MKYEVGRGTGVASSEALRANKLSVSLEPGSLSTSSSDVSSDEPSHKGIALDHPASKPNIFYQ